MNGDPGDGGRRIHRLARRRGACSRGATRLTGVDSFLDYYPRAVKERNLRRRRRAEALPLRRGRPGDRRSCAARGAVRRGRAPGRPGGRAGELGPDFGIYVDSNSWRRSACSRRRRRGAAASSTRRPRRSMATPRGRPSRSTLPRPISPYGVSKLAGEHLCRLYQRRLGLRRSRCATSPSTARASARHGVPSLLLRSSSTRSSIPVTTTATRRATSPTSATPSARTCGARRGTPGPPATSAAAPRERERCARDHRRASRPAAAVRTPSVSAATCATRTRPPAPPPRSSAGRRVRRCARVSPRSSTGCAASSAAAA